MALSVDETSCLLNLRHNCVQACAWHSDSATPCSIERHQGLPSYTLLSSAHQVSFHVLVPPPGLRCLPGPLGKVLLAPCEMENGLPRNCNTSLHIIRSNVKITLGFWIYFSAQVQAFKTCFRLILCEISLAAVILWVLKSHAIHTGGLVCRVDFLSKLGPWSFNCVQANYVPHLGRRFGPVLFDLMPLEVQLLCQSLAHCQMCLNQAIHGVQQYLCLLSLPPR